MKNHLNTWNFSAGEAPIVGCPAFQVVSTFLATKCDPMDPYVLRDAGLPRERTSRFLGAGRGESQEKAAGETSTGKTE